MKKQWIFLMAIMAFVLSGCCCTKKEHLTETSVISTLMARRSIRAYQPRIVEREKMDVILECGINAPNAMNRQPWEVRVVDNPELLAEMTAKHIEQNPRAKSQLEGQRNMFRNAMAVAFVAGKTDGYMGGVFDAALLTENMVIAAQSMGIGSCIMGNPVSFFKSEAGRPYLARLGFSEGYELLMTIGFGYPDESPEAKARDKSKVKYID